MKLFAYPGELGCRVPFPGIVKAFEKRPVLPPLTCAAVWIVESERRNTSSGEHWPQVDCHGPETQASRASWVLPPPIISTFSGFSWGVVGVSCICLFFLSIFLPSSRDFPAASSLLLFLGCLLKGDAALQSRTAPLSGGQLAARPHS